eukprot:2700907-Rhodomonas_salina.1
METNGNGRSGTWRRWWTCARGTRRRQARRTSSSSAAPSPPSLASLAAPPRPSPPQACRRPRSCKCVCRSPAGRSLATPAVGDSVSGLGLRRRVGAPAASLKFNCQCGPRAGDVSTWKSTLLRVEHKSIIIIIKTPTADARFGESPQQL